MQGKDCVDLSQVNNKDLDKVCVRNWITEYSLGNKKERNDLIIG